MSKYNVILSDCDGDNVVGRYDTLEAAKTHLLSVRFYPEYRRTCEGLDISDDGMTGTGKDSTGEFIYQIKTA